MISFSVWFIPRFGNAVREKMGWVGSDILLFHSHRKEK